MALPTDIINASHLICDHCGDTVDLGIWPMMRHMDDCPYKINMGEYKIKPSPSFTTVYKKPEDK